MPAWYFTSLMAWVTDPARARKWYAEAAPKFVAAQVKSAPHWGSWAPVGPWGRHGGRVYSTAIMVLTLQAPYLYEPDFVRRAKRIKPPPVAWQARKLLRKAAKDKDPEVKRLAKKALAR